MVVFDDLETILFSNLVEGLHRHHFSRFLNGILALFSFLGCKGDWMLDLLLDQGVEVQPDLSLVVELVIVDVGHLHLLVKDRLVPGPVIFLKGFPGELLPPPSEGLMSAHLHRVIHVHIDVVEGGAERLWGAMSTRMGAVPAVGVKGLVVVVVIVVRVSVHQVVCVEGIH